MPRSKKNYYYFLGKNSVLNWGATQLLFSNQDIGVASAVNFQPARDKLTTDQLTCSQHKTCFVWAECTNSRNLSLLGYLEFTYATALEWQLFSFSNRTWILLYQDSSSYLLTLPTTFFINCASIRSGESWSFGNYKQFVNMAPLTISPALEEKFLGLVKRTTRPSGKFRIMIILRVILDSLNDANWCCF